MAAARMALLALLLALRAAAGLGAPALPGLDELEEPLDEELLAMESLRSWAAAPSHQVRKGGVIGVVQLASALPGLDELEEPLDEELLAMDSLRSWTKAPFHRLVMLGISLSFLLLFAVTLMRQVWTLEERCSSPKADGGASATAVDGRDVRESLNSKDHAPTLLEAPRNAWARGAPGKQGQAKQAVAADTAAGRDVRESLNSKDHAPTLLEAPRDAWARGAPGTQGHAKEALAADTAAGPALSFSAVVPVVTGAEGADISD